MRSSMGLPALRCHLGNWIYYQSVLNADQLRANVTPGESSGPYPRSTSGLKTLMKRKSWTVPPIVITSKGGAEWFGMTVPRADPRSFAFQSEVDDHEIKVIDETVGIIVISKSAILTAVTNTDLVTAICACKIKPDQQFPVTFIGDSGAKNTKDFVRQLGI